MPCPSKTFGSYCGGSRMPATKPQEYFPKLDLVALQRYASEWAADFPVIQKICLFNGLQNDDLCYVIVIYVPPFTRKMLAGDLSVGIKTGIIIDGMYDKYEVVENEPFGVGVIRQDGRKISVYPVRFENRDEDR